MSVDFIDGGKCRAVNGISVNGAAGWRAVRKCRAHALENDRQAMETQRTEELP